MPFCEFCGALQERVYHDRKFENVEQLLKQTVVLECCALSQRFTSGGVGCSVSYKKMVDILNTNSNSMDVFTVALFFSYRR